MNSSESITKISAALLKSQSEFKPVAKAATNPHFRSKYATLDDILGMAVPVLNANGLSIMQTVDGDSLGTMILHESGEWIDGGKVRLHIDKDNMQGLGSALTYARRYTLGALLGIATEDDDDGNGASTQPPLRNASPAATQTRPAAPSVSVNIDSGDPSGWEDYELRFSEHKGMTLKQVADKFPDDLPGLAQWCRNRWDPTSQYAQSNADTIAKMDAAIEYAAGSEANEPSQ